MSICSTITNTAFPRRSFMSSLIKVPTMTCIPTCVKALVCEPVALMWWPACVAPASTVATHQGACTRLPANRVRAHYSYLFVFEYTVTIQSCTSTLVLYTIWVENTAATCTSTWLRYHHVLLRYCIQIFQRPHDVVYATWHSVFARIQRQFTQCSVRRVTKSSYPIAL